MGYSEEICVIIMNRNIVLIQVLTLFSLRIPFNFHSSIVSFIVSTKGLYWYTFTKRTSFTIWCLIVENKLCIHLKTFLWLRTIGTCSIKKTVFNKSHWQTSTFSFIFRYQGLDLKNIKMNNLNISEIYLIWRAIRCSRFSCLNRQTYQGMAILATFYNILMIYVKDLCYRCL